MDPLASSSTYSSSLAEADGYVQWVLAFFAPFLAPPIIEVGLGHGGFVNDLVRLGPYIGLDIDQKAVIEASARHPGVRFVTADITHRRQLEAVKWGQAQTVLCCNVLEHIKEDNLAVTNLLSLIAPGGHLLVQVPAHTFLYNDLDRLAHHVTRYQRRTLLDLFAGQPVDVIKVEFINPIGFFGWFLNRFLPHKNLENASVCFQVQFFLKYFLPLSRVLTPLTRNVFGQSLMLVAKKR